jgi:hypothetical protein
VASNNVLGRARLVGDDEAAASNVEASPAKEPVVLLSPACASPEDFAAYRGIAAAASASVKCSIAMRSTATEGRSAPKCQRKSPDPTLKRPSDGLECR